MAASTFSSRSLLQLHNNPAPQPSLPARRSQHQQLCQHNQGHGRDDCCRAAMVSCNKSFPSSPSPLAPQVSKSASHPSLTTFNPRRFLTKHSHLLISPLGATPHKSSKPTSIAPKSPSTAADPGFQTDNSAPYTGSSKTSGKPPPGPGSNTTAAGKCSTTPPKTSTNQ